MKIKWSRIIFITLIIMGVGNVIGHLKKNKTESDNSALNQSMKLLTMNKKKVWSPNDYQQVSDILATTDEDKLPKYKDAAFIHLISLNINEIYQIPSIKDRLAILRAYSFPIIKISSIYEESLKKGNPLYKEVTELYILTTNFATITIKTLTDLSNSLTQKDSEIASNISNMISDIAPAITESALLLTSRKYKFEISERILMAENLNLNLPSIWESLPNDQKNKILMFLESTLKTENDPKLKSILTDILSKLSL